MSFPFPVIAPAVAVPAVTQGTVAQQNDVSDLSTYTFASLTAGITVDAYPIIGIVARSASPPDFISVTLGGQPCVQLCKVYNGTTVIAWYSAPRGATGSLVINFDVTMVRCLAAIIPLFNLKSSTTPTAVNTSTADPMVAAIDCQAGGWIGGLSYNGGGASDNIAWSNLTEKFDVNLESAAAFSWASDVFASAQTARSITANPVNSAVGPVLALIALR